MVWGIVRVGGKGVGVLAGTLAVVFGTPYLFAFDQTFTVSPTVIHLESYVGQGAATETFTIKPSTGDWEYGTVPYWVYPEDSYGEEYCLEWSEYRCERYDFQKWADNGLLCNFITFGEPDDGTQSLSVYDNDTEDMILVTLQVPCHSGTCGMYDSYNKLVFPQELLDKPLTCDVFVDTPPQPTLTPMRAYAQVATESNTVEVTATVRMPVSGEPTFAFPDEEGYDGVRGVNSGGPNPERGYADSEVFTFKTIYTHMGNSAPEFIDVKIGGALTIPMQVDSSAQDSLLHDGDYSNGEQYVATTTLQKGSVTYEFHAQVGAEWLVLELDGNNVPLTCTAGYSSVAFLPGIKASRLFMDGILFENKLWEPNRDGDARKLALTDEGESENDVYTKVGSEGVLDQIFGVTLNVYKSLLDDLEDWKEEHLISDYAVLGYDWRYPYETFLGTGVANEAGELRFGRQYTTNTPYLYEQLRILTDRSDSGRLIMVGHSMGGLVIKKLLADLEDTPDHPYRDLLGRVDQVVLVASPQLGTPKAVAALLHGMYEELDFPFVHYPDFATNETLRILGRNIPSVYTLLPSRMYFDRVRDVNEEGEEGSYTELILNLY